MEVHLSLSDDKGDVDRVRRPWDILSAGHKIGTPKPLFRELVSVPLSEISKAIQICFCFCFWVIDVYKILEQKDEELEGYKNKFAGSQADRIIRAEAEAENVAEQLKKTEVSGVIFYPFSN